MIPSKSDFIHIFNDFIPVYSPGARAEIPLGDKLLMSSFKTISLKYDFKHILNDFIHLYSPRAGTDNPLGTKILMSAEIPYHFAHLLPV